MFKTTDTGALKQDKKCQPCWYIILSTMSGIQACKQYLIRTTTSCLHKNKSYGIKSRIIFKFDISVSVVILSVSSNIYLTIIQNNGQGSLATTTIPNRLEVIFISTTTLATMTRLITTIITNTLYRVQQEMSIISIRCRIQIRDQWIERLRLKYQSYVR